MDMLREWMHHGFAVPPSLQTAPDSGLPLFRCWGGSSTEWGSGYFSLQDSASVIDAELRFNVVIDWSNTIRHQSMFRLRGGSSYWIGPIAHGPRDLSLPAPQVFVEPPLRDKVILIASKFRRIAQDRVVVIPARTPLATGLWN